MRSSVLAALVPCALLASPARPCSISEPFLSGPVAPAQGAQAVPTNAKLHVSLSGGFVDFGARLLSAGSEPALLPMTRDDQLAVVDLGALAPGTAYTIEIVAEPRFEGDVPSTIEPIDFVTADADDDAPPSIAGAPPVKVEHQPGSGPFQMTSCGAFPSNNMIVVGPIEADDDTGVAALRLYRLDDNGGRALVATTMNDSDHLVGFEPTAGTYRYAVVALDLAGNESEPAIVEAWVSNVGCSAAAVRATGTPASLALLGLLAVVTRRRPARRR